MRPIKTPHTALVVGATGAGKTYCVWELLLGPYRRVFETIVVVCPTISWNLSYHSRPEFWSDPDVLLVPPAWLDQHGLQKVIKTVSLAMAGETVLFIVDDLVADEDMGKRRSALTELVNSGRHRGHSLWLLSQSYTSIPKTVRAQAQFVVTFWKKDIKVWDQLVAENAAACKPEDLERARSHLAKSRHNCAAIEVNPPASVHLL